MKVICQSDLLTTLMLLFGMNCIIANHLPWRHSCSKVEARFQSNNMDFVDPTICDTELGWAFAQLHIPDATVFLDVGANLGFTSAMIFGLWSPGHSISMNKLHEVLKIEKPYSRNHDEGTSTYCQDGIVTTFAQFPLTCIGAYPKYDSKPAPSNNIDTPLWCSIRNNIHVYSFDGEKNHSTNIKKVINKYFPDFDYNLIARIGHVGESMLSHSEMSHLKKPFWNYNHMAVTPPLEGNPTVGFFEQLGHEGSHFVPGKPSEEQLNDPINPVILVPVTTIDQFCKDRNITKVDVLKMDVEDLEPEILKGAIHTLQHR